MRRAEPGRRARGGGLTLIEVMVALAVVAITLAAGIKAAGALTDNAQRLSDVTAAQWCADNQLTGLKLTRQFPGIGESDFDCVQLGSTYRGRQIVRSMENPNFRRVDAQVADADGRPVLRLTGVVSRF